MEHNLEFLEFLRSSCTFVLNKVLTRPRIFHYVKDTAFVYTSHDKIPESVKLSLGLDFSSETRLARSGSNIYYLGKIENG